MFEDKVFIIELPAVDGLPAGAVVVGEVASLAHKLRDDAVEAAAFEAKALLVSAQAAEVLCSNLTGDLFQISVSFSSFME